EPPRVPYSTLFRSPPRSHFAHPAAPFQAAARIANSSHPVRGDPRRRAYLRPLANPRSPACPLSPAPLHSHQGQSEEKRRSPRLFLQPFLRPSAPPPGSRHPPSLAEPEVRFLLPRPRQAARLPWGEPTHPRARAERRAELPFLREMNPRLRHRHRRYRRHRPRLCQLPAIVQVRASPEVRPLSQAPHPLRRSRRVLPELRGLHRRQRWGPVPRRSPRMGRRAAPRLDRSQLRGACP